MHPHGCLSGTHPFPLRQSAFVLARFQPQSAVSAEPAFKSPRAAQSQGNLCANPFILPVGQAISANRGETGVLKLIRPRLNMAVILLVDENPLRASMRLNLLQRATPDVVRVSSPADALCMVESEDFSRVLRLVVTGSHVSGISRPEFVLELRRRLPDVPVLVLTASDEKPAEHPEVPGVYYMSANSPEELRTTVDSLLHNGSRQTA